MFEQLINTGDLSVELEIVDAILTLPTNPTGYPSSHPKERALARRAFLQAIESAGVACIPTDERHILDEFCDSPPEYVKNALEERRKR